MDLFAPHGPADDDREHYELALMDMLKTAPNVLVSMLMLLTCGIAAGYPQVSLYFLVPWSIVALVSGVGRQMLINRFKRQTEAERMRYRREWVLFARHAPTVHACVYASLVLVSFPSISEHGKIIVSLVGAGMVVGAIGFSALAGRTMLYLLLGSSGIAWFLFGGELALPVTFICIVGLVMYIPARKNQAASAVERIRLARMAEKLSEELARQNEILAQRDREKTLLLATASHDLRQPVHALGIVLENMRSRDSMEERQRRQYVAQAQLELLSDMLRSIMDISQMDLGTYTLHVSQVPVLELINESTTGFFEPARQKGLSLLVQTDAVAGYCIETDRGLLGRMLINLVSNAIKYTHSGKVTVTATCNDQGQMLLAVSDTGVGIAPDRQSDIYGAFVRLHSTDATGSAVQGLGIGLSVVDRGAKLLGLGLDLQSTPGVGSCFTLKVPARLLVAPEKLHLPVVPVADTVPAALAFARTRQNILLIEDDDVTRQAMAELLESWGYQVRTALTEAEAIAGLQASSPDLLISDYHLGGSHNGADVIKRIRQLTGAPGLPAILLTGDVHAMLDELDDPGSARLLHKPLRVRELRGALRSLLDDVVSAAA